MRIVIKIGTSTLVHPGGRLNIRRTEQLCKVISDLKNAGEEIIIVSSGAIAMGLGKLGLSKRPEAMAAKQAAASVGQCELMYIYDNLFSAYHHNVGQMLICADDLADVNRRENIMATLNCLLDMGTIPVINENDSIATEEINSVGDNDTLGAIIAVHTQADLLILLSDIDGLYTADPNKDENAGLIREVYEIDDSIMALGGGSSSLLGTGGMETKLNAARRCTKAGCDMVIANGNAPELLYDIRDGKKVGTRFYSSGKKGAKS